MGELKLPVIDNYWQTETGWPMLSTVRGIEDTKIKFGTPSFPVYGYDLKIFREDGSECDANEKGIVGVVPPLPPGCLSTVWGQDERFVSTYFSLFKDPLVYSSFDWGISDDENYHFILGRTDDVINVAGHRLGTREIEEAVQAHNAIAEVAVVGVNDQLKGQEPMAFAVVKDAGEDRHAGTARGAGSRGEEDRRQHPRCHRAAEACAFRHRSAQDAFRQDAAPLDPGAGRRARSRRPDHARRSDHAGADTESACSWVNSGSQHEKRGLRAAFFMCRAVSPALIFISEAAAFVSLRPSLEQALFGNRNGNEDSGPDFWCPCHPRVSDRGNVEVIGAARFYRAASLGA